MREQRERERKRETNIVEEGERIRFRFVTKNTAVQQVTFNERYFLVHSLKPSPESARPCPCHAIWFSGIA